MNAMDVGTIRLQVNSVVRYKQRERPQTRPPPAVDTVHEEKKRNLKHSVGYVVTAVEAPASCRRLSAFLHCLFIFLTFSDHGTLTRFGKAKPIEVVTSTLIPIGVAELCSFVFNYRDLGMHPLSL